VNATPPEAAGRFSAALRLGPRFDVGLGTGWSRVGLAIMLAPELSFTHVRLGLGLGIDAFPSLRVSANAAELSLTELSPRALASIGWVTRELTLALHTGPTWNVMSLRGRSPGGLENRTTLHGWEWSVALTAQRTFARGFALGALLELHTAATRLHFDVNEKTLLDRGRLRVTLGVDLTFRTSILSSK
jgi:hypothetical protein